MIDCNNKFCLPFITGGNKLEQYKDIFQGNSPQHSWTPGTPNYSGNPLPRKLFYMSKQNNQSNCFDISNKLSALEEKMTSINKENGVK